MPKTYTVTVFYNIDDSMVFENVYSVLFEGPQTYDGKYVVILIEGARHFLNAEDILMVSVVENA